MVKYTCDNCGNRLATDGEPGAREDCPGCGSANVIPQPSRSILSRLTADERVRTSLLSAAIFSILILVGVGFWLLYPKDTWERANAPRIRELTSKVVSLASEGRRTDALAEHRELTILLKGRAIRDPDLARAVSKAAEAARAVAGQPSEDDRASTGEAAEYKGGVPYRVVKKWGIPNGGYGMVVVIQSEYRNERDMRRLGDTLRHDTRNDRNAIAIIFDDAEAAGMYDRASYLGKDEGSFYESHLIGTYMRNINTGFHALEIMLQGIGGAKGIHVRY